MGKLVILQNVKDNKTFPYAKFRFSSIPFGKVIMNKLLFFQDKAHDPGLKVAHLDFSEAHLTNFERLILYCLSSMGQAASHIY